jgi:diguanylate cyclase (GGDEF)-like protein
MSHDPSRSTRLLSSLNQARRIALRLRSLQTASRQICLALASSGRHRYVWIAVAAEGEAGALQMLGCGGSGSGPTTEKLARLELEDRKGPSWTAMSAGQPCVIERIGHAVPWAADAHLLGLTWAAALPIRDRRGSLGVLTMLSAADDALEPDEVEMVRELADDLAPIVSRPPAPPPRPPAELGRQAHEDEARSAARSDELQELNRQLRLELLERKKAEEALRQRLEVERAIAAISARLVVPSNLSQALEAAMVEIGELTSASRASLFLLADDGATVGVAHEWCGEGTRGRPAAGRSVAAHAIPWLMGRISRHDAVQITDVAELPREAAAERQLFESYDSKSVLLQPIHAGEEVAGFLAIEDVVSAGSWRDEDEALLRLAAQTIGNALLRRRASEALQKANDQLQRWVRELEAHNRQIRELSDLGSQLQSCQKVEEAHGIIAQSAQRLLAPESGGVYLFSNSRNIVEAVAVWGNAPPAERVFTPDSCWALRRGHTHLVRDSSVGLLCQHLGRIVPSSYVCIPMMAQGEALGMLHLQSGMTAPETALGEAQLQLAAAVADQLALAIANLKLRETLHGQSIRDPLTSLYNRRYMVESLDRDIRRAARNGDSVGLMMLDLDHFKRFNDAHGHEVGDQLLRELGALLLQQFRGEDVACRYGGEEFTVILPEASPEDTRRRAEQLREAVQGIRITHQGRDLEGVTISIGVAIYPNHAASAEQLLAVADSALYRAKGKGRNCVIVAPEAP